MAATTTISASALLTPGRSTMSLVGSSSPLPSPPLSASNNAVEAIKTGPISNTISNSSPAPAPVAAITSATKPEVETVAALQSSTVTGSALALAPLSASVAAVPAVASVPVSAPLPSGVATTFFDDMINAPQPPANILTLSPTTSLPDLYHDFFDNHPELYDSDQSSDPEMDLDPDSPLIRARTMADLRQTVPAIQVPLIADRPKLETIDTINLMIHQQHQHGNILARQPGLHSTNGHHHGHDSQGSDDQGTDLANGNQPQRRKKASRACFHCQKAHLTCDDSRPCQRCVKRDLAGTCADGVRKKAKYLQDALDSQQANKARQGSVSDQDQQSSTRSQDSPLADANSLFSFPLASDYGFGSEAVNLEYSILSTMLSSPTQELHSMSDLSMAETWQRQGTLEAMANSLAQHGQLQKAMANNTHPNSTSTTGNNSASATTAALQHSGAARASKRKFPSNTPENVYANTKQPFNYTDGFHYLLRYVRERMDKDEMMRICRAMAMFRPSFIALITNLTPEDLIFMEKCFQRTILEFEKLISFSGTPTVVWRRTGEIALVGKEFSLLTQWGRDQLVGKKTYIYELMDNQSAVEYWEKFSTHAFENTEQTVMTTCILLSPTNRVVPCTFCFTIKRDIFDIPLAIVGNFLPILS